MPEIIRTEWYDEIRRIANDDGITNEYDRYQLRKAADAFERLHFLYKALQESHATMKGSLARIIAIVEGDQVVADWIGDEIAEAKKAIGGDEQSNQRDAT